MFRGHVEVLEAALFWWPSTWNVGDAVNPDFVGVKIREKSSNLQEMGFATQLNDSIFQITDVVYNVGTYNHRISI